MSVRRFAARVLLRPLAAFVLALVAAAAPGVSRAQEPGQVCSGLVPFAVTPPAGATEFLTGCESHYLLALGPAATQGNFTPVDFPLCDQGACAGLPPSGKNTVRCLIANGYGCCLATGALLTPEPPNASGPFLQGLQARWDSDTDQQALTCFTAYHGNGCRVLPVPVTTLSGLNPSPVTILDFATMFLVERPSTGANSWLEVEFLPTGVVATRASSWGQLKTRYR